MIVSRASISLLRLTVPADLYQSGILIEVHGVEVRLKINLDDQETCETVRPKYHRNTRERPSKTAKSDRPRDSQSQVHDPGGYQSSASAFPVKDEDSSSEYLPNTVDLAQSFLQTEPQEEKTELQAAILQSQSQYLDQSQISSDDGSEAPDVGMGGALSLPGFLADFLKGVGDRVQFRIKNIELNVDLKVNLPPESSTRSDASEKSDPVTIRLLVEELAVYGASEYAIPTEQQTTSPVATSQTRRISVKNIQAMLISESSIFANLSRSTAPSSPETKHANTVVTETSRTSVSSSNTAPHITRFGTSQRTVSDPIAPGAPSSSIVADGDGFADPDKGREIGERSASASIAITAASHYQDSMLGDSFYASGGESQVDEDEAQDPSSPHASAYLDAGHQSSPQHSFASQDRDVESSPEREESPPAMFDAFLSPSDPGELPEPAAFQPSRSVDNLLDPITSSGHLSMDASRRDPNPESEKATSPTEDLSESKIFSHEEASSMYMSAISHTSVQEQAKSARVPGDWESDEEDHYQNSDVCHSGLPDHASVAPGDGLGLLGNESSQGPESPSTCVTPLSNSVVRRPSMPERPILKSEHSSPDNERGSSQGSGDFASNSKQPLLLAKRLFSINSVEIQMPLGKPEKAVVSDVLQHRQTAQRIQSTPNSQSPKPESDLKIHIDVETLMIVGDMALTKMTILLVEQMNALHQSSHNQKQPRTLKGSFALGSNIQLTVREISWKFLDVVKGETPPISSTLDTGTKGFELSAGCDVLLKAKIEHLNFANHKTESASTSKISIGKLLFGYVADDVVSFNSELKMRESTRDILAPVDEDLVVTITKSSKALKVDLTTLPVKITLDLRRLDETFSWFGGFSSMLGLGNSMMTTVTIVDPGMKQPQPMKPSRGVHFEGEGSAKAPRQASKSVENKITARIGGLAFDIQGTQSALRFESSAMKLVSRSEGIGLQVDRLNLSGPYCDEDDQSDPSMSVNLSNVRVEYLSTPKEIDLARLLGLLSPSKGKYDQDDDILLDILLRQRRQGGVLRATVESSEGRISSLNDLQCFPALAEDFKKLSTVAKYLPEDDRPGIMTLALVRNFKLNVGINESFGEGNISAEHLEVAHVTFPSLTALGIKSLYVLRSDVEELVGPVLPSRIASDPSLPMIMARFIGNEMEPTAKVKLHNLRLEYHVSTAMALMGLKDDIPAETVVSDLVNSVATLTSRRPIEGSPPKLSSHNSASSDYSFAGSKALRLDLTFRDSVIGLNPRGSHAKGLIVLTDTHFLGSMPKGLEATATLNIKKASLMLIDNRERIIETNKPGAQRHPNSQAQTQILAEMGFVSMGFLSAASANLQVVQPKPDQDRAIDVELKDELLVFESCADSTQTLSNLLNGLKPPMPPSKELKYRTELIPVEDMLASFSGDAFTSEQDGQADDDDLPLGLDEGDIVDDEVPQNLEFVSSFYNPNLSASYDEDMADSMLDDDLESLANPSVIREIGDKNLLESFQDQAQIAPGNAPLDFKEDHFGSGSSVGGTAHRWNTKQNTYGLSNKFKINNSPLKVRVRDVHFIWNLFDGYDWQHTRDTISQAVADVQTKATERLSRKDKRRSWDAEEEEEDVIGDFLFNSIYIGIPANRDPAELTRQVNHNIDDLVSESESYATSTSSGSPSRQGRAPRLKGRKLRLARSKSHKMTFELKGVSADMIVFPPSSGEIQSSIDIRVQDLEIFDHVPTSTWKKFATYMHDAGERESGTSMIHLEILNVKPVPNLAASEIILKATILPLRLHVDQDALDFMSRFFEFKDPSAEPTTPKSEAPFLQRVEVNSVRVKLDFKPKRVDYAGLRSGHTTEFMNFFILDRANMTLRHVIIYGVSGFDRLGKTLNDIWMPDIKRNQLPGVLAGLAPVRSLVNVGGGVRDLVVIPIREYKKDGRVVRSFQKGALAFAKTTAGELVKLGAKLAIGTQTVLQSAEDLLVQQPPQKRTDISGGWEDTEIDEEEKKQISLYADQPVGVVQGLRGAYASLERDLLTAKDAIVAMPGEILESGTAGEAARAVLRGAPTVILRPAMGVSKAVGQTLMGATNSLDPQNRRRVEDVNYSAPITLRHAKLDTEVQKALRATRLAIRECTSQGVWGQAGLWTVA